MRLMTLVIFFLLSCGTEKPVENPTTCEVKEVPEGLQFSCVDKNGNLSTGIVRHGERGASGEVGQPGTPGQNGSGLKIATEVRCKGSIEGWMENSAYEVDFQLTAFETGDQFLSSNTKLVRDAVVINQRNASAFFAGGIELSPVINDGQFSFRYDGVDVLVTSLGGVSAKIPCEVKP